MNVFCSTSLPLTSTRWFDQLLSFALSTLSKQCSVDKTQRERRESNPERLGGKRERYLCAMPSPCLSINVTMTK